MNRSMTHRTGPAAQATGTGDAVEVPLLHTASWRPALGLGVASLLLAGALYSAVATGAAGLLFPERSAGSLMRDADGQVRGSRLLAQPFAGDGWFQTRPSAAGYDPMAAAGSNLARSNPALAARVAEATAAVARREGIAPAQVPADLVTQSGGGLDPELSPAAARLQAARVARVRGLPLAQVQALVDAHVQAPLWGVLGQPRVNVMDLNRAVQADADAR